MAEVFLKNKQKFEQVLTSYQMSPHAREVLDKVNYVVMVGPTAAGRNTVINELVAHHNFTQLISDTTRPPKFRDGKMEKHGETYYFRSEEDMLRDLEAGLFLEAELIHGQQVSGTSIRELEKLLEKDAVGINEVEFGGSKHLLSLKSSLPVIALLPPSFDIWMERFHRREKIEDQEYLNRVETFLKVLDYIESEPRIIIVVNHEYRDAAQHIDEIVRSGVTQTEEEMKQNQAIIDEFRMNLAPLKEDLLNNKK